MGFWSWLIGVEDEPQTRDVPTPEMTPPVSDVLLQALLNNEVITREKALTLPAVSGAVDFISNTIASMPVKLYKYKQGKVENLEDDTRVKLLNGDTGDTLDAFQMKKAMVMDYLLGKGGYCYIERSRNEVVALRYVEDIYITVLKNFKPIYKDFVILVEGNQYQPYDFIKLLRNTKDGASGVGLTVEVSKALETAYQTLIYQLSLVQSGGNKKGFLKSQRKLGQDEINTLKQAWTRMYSDNSENVVVLNNGLEFQEASNSSVEMQLDQNKNTLRGEINNIFHIYPDDFLQTFKEAIYPIIKAFETALNRDLLLEKEKKNHYFEFDVKEIVRASLQERYQAYKLAKETGFMTLNEIRRAENMEFVEGLDVVNVGLGAVLYDINTHQYYTPNTDTVGTPNDGESSSTEEMDKMLENHELAEAFDASGNSAERDIEERYNDNHDGKTGKFAPKNGGGSGGGSGGGNSEGGSGGDSEGGSGGSSGDGSNGSGGSGDSGYDKYSYSSDIDDNQPSIGYDKNVNTPLKQSALAEYTAGDYDSINSYLNGTKSFSDADKERISKTVEQIDSCITGKTDRDMMVYRGIAIDKGSLSVGDEIVNKGYTSTSAVKSVADDFANYYGGTTLSLKVPKGTEALGIGFHTNGDFDEAEVLFGRGAKIKIVEIGDDGVIGEVTYG